MKKNTVYLNCWPEDPAWPDPAEQDPYDIEYYKPALRR